jgi:Protein of unknown function (DUF2829)
MNDIGWAVKHMRNREKVCRAGWNGKGMWLCLIRKWSNEYGFDLALAPFVAMRTADAKLVPWLCSQTDLLATDWEIAE